MKKLICIISIFCIIALTNTSCDDKGYTPGSSIVNTFYNYYPNAYDVEWFYVNGFQVADFEINNQDKQAWFSYDGTWLYTKTEINYSLLPAAVQISFMKSYGDWTIDDVIEIETASNETYYNINIENSTTDLALLYDSEGYLIQSYVDVLPYTWWNYVN